MAQAFTGGQLSRPATELAGAVEKIAKIRRGRFLRNPRSKGNKLPPFVPLTWDLLNSKCFQNLPYAAAKALPYFLGKVKGVYHDPQRFLMDFTFSYPEAKRYGFSFGTFSKVIKNLITFGFVDPVDKGGLRGFRKGYNIFRLSKRWEAYGTLGFKPIDWETFLPKI